MSRLIDTDMEQLTHILLKMGDLAHKTVFLSLRSYIEGESAYSEIKERSDILLSMAEEAEDRTFEIIARFQPVASDLRILKSYMKISYDFARYGRYALDVSQVYETLGGLAHCKDWIRVSIEEMGQKTLDMVYTSVSSLKSHDTQLAERLSETERQMDELYLQYLGKLIKKALIAEECTISSLLVAKYLERIADHATYIGESIVYLSTGEKATLR